MTNLISRAGVDSGSEASGYSSMQECLRIQVEAEQLGWFARLVGRNPLTPDARSWYELALRERDVAHVLAELGPNWRIFLNPPSPNAAPHSSFVVMGPPGILVIGEREVDGRTITISDFDLRVDGQDTELVRTELGESSRAARLLSEAARTTVAVDSILVIGGNAKLSFGKLTPPIDITQPGELRGWLLARRRIVSDETIDYFAMIAARSGNWDRQPIISPDIVRRVQRFERLQQEIANARRRMRRVIMSGLVLVAATAAALLLPHL